LVLSASNITRSGVEETMLIQITTDSKIGGEKNSLFYEEKKRKRKEKHSMPFCCDLSKKHVHIFIEKKTPFA